MHACVQGPWHIGAETGFLAGLAVGAVMLSLWASRLREFPGRDAFIMTHIGMLWWLSAAALEMAAPTFSCKMLIATLAWPGVMVVAVFWCVFLHRLVCASDARFQPQRIWPFLIGIGAGSGLAVSNPWHGWLYGPQSRLAGTMPGAQIIFDHGPLFFVFVIVLYAFLSFGILTILRALIANKSIMRNQLKTCLGFTVLPIAINLAYVFGGVRIFDFDPTPFSFIITLAGFTWLITNSFDDGATNQV